LAYVIVSVGYRRSVVCAPVKRQILHV